MKADFLDNYEFFTGVPDSLLRPFCDHLMCRYGIDPKHHVIAANEGNCTALAAGYHLATGKIPVVYLQNSGEGNIINPVASLLNDNVYAIPCIFVVGWRGEPGVHDEPQHVYQGKVTEQLLRDMDIDVFVIDKTTTREQTDAQLRAWESVLAAGKQVAFVVRKGALETTEKCSYHNDYTMPREEVIEHIIRVSGSDPIISTTGKASRELFELREKKGEGHAYDFLTVGSMGHSSSIALGVAVNKPETKVWCVDGDGAALMHLGAMAVVGSVKCKNLVHIVLNNGAHETVGGLPTVAESMELTKIALACGYEHAECVSTFEALDRALEQAKARNALSFLEIKCALGARADLGRPTTTALENKQNFMKYLSECK